MDGCEPGIGQRIEEEDYEGGQEEEEEEEVEDDDDGEEEQEEVFQVKAWWQHDEFNAMITLPRSLALPEFEDDVTKMCVRAQTDRQTDRQTDTSWRRSLAGSSSSVVVVGLLVRVEQQENQQEE